MQCTNFASRQCLGYVLAALSSHVEETRALAYHVLALLHNHLDAAVGQTSAATPSMLLYLLDCLRHSISERNARLPCMITTFLSRTAHLLTVPGMYTCLSCGSINLLLTSVYCILVSFINAFMY